MREAERQVASYRYSLILHINAHLKTKNFFVILDVFFINCLIKMKRKKFYFMKRFYIIVENHHWRSNKFNFSTSDWFMKEKYTEHYTYVVQGFTFTCRSQIFIWFNCIFCFSPNLTFHHVFVRLWKLWKYYSWFLLHLH